MLILIAGPYRSGTGDDPQKMAENLKRLEAPSYALFKAGHIPMIGEWVALPSGTLPGAQRSAMRFTMKSSTRWHIAYSSCAKACCGFPATPRAPTTMCGSRANAEFRSGST